MIRTATIVAFLVGMLAMGLIISVILFAYEPSRYVNDGLVEPDSGVVGP